MTPDPPDGRAETDCDEEPSVMGAGCGCSPIPTKAEAEAVWRTAYIARMCERGIEINDARACCNAGPAILSDGPKEAADAELEYWASDGESAHD